MTRVQVATEQTISPSSNVWLELQDILFFVKCLKNPPINFNIYDYVSFSQSSTRFGSNNRHSLSLQPDLVPTTDILSVFNQIWFQQQTFSQSSTRFGSNNRHSLSLQPDLVPTTDLNINIESSQPQDTFFLL